MWTNSWKSLFNAVAITLAITALPGVSAGPACARRASSATECIAQCNSRWGWPGMAMGTDPWGPVIKPSSDSVDTTIASGCGATPQQVFTKPFSNVIPNNIISDRQIGAGPPSVPSPATVSTVLTPSSSSSSSIALSTSSSSSVVQTTSSSSLISSSTSSFSSSSTISSSSSSLSSSSSSASPSPSAAPSAPINNIAAAPSSSSQQAPPTSSPAPAPEAKATSSTQTPQTTQVAQTTQSSSSGSSGATSNGDINAYLTAHNSIRSQHGASALTWNNNLASKAQQWANNCQFKHSGGSLGPFGENLAAGTGSSYDIAAAVKSWTDEVSEYNPSNPQPSHFTQVVWKASTEVGCALAMCNGIFDPSFGPAKFFVCEYSVQGNVIGEFPQNVQA